MLTDYKIVRRTNLDDGSQTGLVRFYEGDTTTEDELDESGNVVPVTRYRRSLFLAETTYAFREAKTDSSLRQYLNDELAKDATRTPISEQVNA